LPSAAATGPAGDAARKATGPDVAPVAPMPSTAAAASSAAADGTTGAVRVATAIAAASSSAVSIRDPRIGSNAKREASPGLPVEESPSSVAVRITAVNPGLPAI